MYVIRPPDIVVGGLIFYQGFFFLSFFRRLISELANGTQPKSATCWEVTAVWKRMSKIWGIPSPTNRGPKTTYFGRLRNLTATLTAYIFGTKHDIQGGSKSKLLIFSEYVNKTEKIGETWTNTNSYRENDALSDIFTWNIYFTIVLCLNIL